MLTEHSFDKNYDIFSGNTNFAEDGATSVGRTVHIQKSVIFFTEGGRQTSKAFKFQPNICLKTNLFPFGREFEFG